ncbi:ABC transporter permease [Mucilaginibacter sp. BJC16-A38]|uniref:ABC transporter permease n=1 Tax=Mucilaginibacter phenanthrenivorans TaxID=1234842 RepID=UPI00215755E5|nr:ABC transporter permease [Mucilaginibacter phenanthrenivorans]MCR8560213.1 ABC transporter permease [Mucilaginibacter phenanthrenivorans]
MIKNYLKIAWRNLNKHRFFSLVNICGLAIGVAAFWIIALYVTDEWSYDRYNEKSDRIFRVAQHGKWGNGGFNLAITSIPYAPALKADYPEVEDAIRIDLEGGGKITYGEKQIEANDISFTDNAIFNIFTYHFLSGDPETALSKPHSIVLTKTLAEKIFGDASDAMDKTISFDKNDHNVVTGVIDDVPANSTFKFSALRSLNVDYNGRWGSAGVFTFVLLKNHDDYKKIEAHSDDFFNKHLKGDFAGVKYKMELQPLTSIHLHSNLDYEMGNNGNIAYVYVFSIVGLLILAIAVINYVNLTTARSSVRIKEIGIRKVIGSGRSQLLYMFFSESVLLAVFATIAGMVLIQAAIPYFNLLSGKSLDIWYFGIAKSLLIFAFFALIIGLISGIYPALFLSGFNTIPAMKGQLGNQSSTVIFRKGLVIFQFVITIVMIVGSSVIYQQLHYVLNKDLGFNKSQMLTFHIHSHDARAKTEEIKSQLLQNPLIESVAVAGNPIGNNDIGSNDFNIGPDGNNAPDTKMVESLIIDEDFIPAMQIKMAEGRNFIKGVSDTANHSIIVNETLIKELGWTNPIGRRVRTGVDHGVIQYSTIVGVVKDFNTYSLQHKISPMVLNLPAVSNDKDNLYVRLRKNNIPAALSYLQQVYARFDPENKVDYHFLDQNFAAQYQSEQKQGNLLLIFTVLAISIACLGLFGLVTFTAEQRVKEIGIRKVLGAGIHHIVNMLAKELVLLVLIAAVVATPLAWMAASKWLQSFEYRTSIHWWVFAAAGLAAMLLAFITISVRSVKAALANPVKSLRSE